MILKEIKGNIKIKLIALILLTLIPLTILQIISINSGFWASVDAQIMASEEFAEVLSTAYINYLENIWTFRTSYTVKSRLERKRNNSVYE